MGTKASRARGAWLGSICTTTTSRPSSQAQQYRARWHARLLVQTHARRAAGCLAAKCILARYAPRSRGPRKNQRIKPSTGSSTTATIQISFFSFEAALWKILIMAQISPISIRRPKMPLYPKFIILLPSLFSRRCQSLRPFHARLTFAVSGARRLRCVVLQAVVGPRAFQKGGIRIGCFCRRASVIGARRPVWLLRQVASVAIGEPCELRIARFVIGEIGAYLRNRAGAHLVPLAAAHLQA